ncbi:MAG: ATP-binding protein [Deltaproteobacteria bacterium]|nr:ATP-binding protein [Deltaproteobacteria bacterium]
MFKRIINLLKLLNKKSIFFFGPRATGKTFLINQELQTLPNVKIIDLLYAPTFDRLSRRPTLIGEEIAHNTNIIVIDEVQRLPRLLDEVHRLIETKNIRFLLTGSSARKLRHGGANLLAGRAWQAQLFPLCFNEFQQFNLDHYLLFGGLPFVVNSIDPWEELKAYSGTYLREEIVAEAAVRRLEHFVSFLDIVATKIGEEINYASLGNDVGINPRTIQNFFTLLDDTLLGFCLEPYRKTKRRKAISRSKFYLADLGVTSSLLGRHEIARQTEAFERSFEHFIALELRAYLSYRRFDLAYNFWRTHTGFEVDFIIGDKLAIEVKSTNFVHERHLKGLRALREEQLIKSYCVISHDDEERIVDGITIYPWQKFLSDLWADKVITQTY